MDRLLGLKAALVANELWHLCIIGARVVVILLLASIALRLVRRLIGSLERVVFMRRVNGEDAKRIDTLAQVFRYGAAVVITLIAGTLVLAEFGVSIAPILGAAGVAGIAVGFGAQSLIKDYFTGFCILLENQIRQGDVVEAGGKKGRVERVTLRHLQLRDREGNVHYVPNGLITTVTNLSRDYAVTRVDVDITCRDHVEPAFDIMRSVGTDLRGCDAFGDSILEEIEIAGLERWDDSIVTLRARLTTRPLEQGMVRREYLRRLKTAFAGADIAALSSQLVVHPTGQPDAA